MHCKLSEVSPPYRKKESGSGVLNFLCIYEFLWIGLCFCSNGMQKGAPHLDKWQKREISSLTTQSHSENISIHWFIVAQIHFKMRKTKSLIYYHKIFVQKLRTKLFRYFFNGRTPSRHNKINWCINSNEKSYKYKSCLLR